jgi:hypothetical protein
MLALEVFSCSQAAGPMLNAYMSSAVQIQNSREPNRPSCFSSLISFLALTAFEPFQFSPAWVATDHDQNDYGSGAGSGMWRGEKADRK